MGFFFIILNNASGCSNLGTYRETLFISDKLLKKYLTILSSKEWNVTIAKIPSFFKTLAAFISP